MKKKAVFYVGKKKTPKGSADHEGMSGVMAAHVKAGTFRKKSKK